MTSNWRGIVAAAIVIGLLAYVACSRDASGQAISPAVHATEGRIGPAQPITPTATVTATLTATASPTDTLAPSPTPWVIIVTREVPVTTTPLPLRVWVEAQPGTILAGARRPAGGPDGGESWGYIGADDAVRAAEWWADGGYDYQLTCWAVVPTETAEPAPTATPAPVFMPWSWKPRRR